MSLKPVVAVAVSVVVILGGGASLAQYAGTPVAQAQDSKSAEPKGVKATNLYTSLGPNWRGTGSIPIVITGQTIELAPGGQTGRQRHLVPSIIYVLDGVLTTNSEGGPGGVSGAQYHSAGQTYMDATGVWHNHSNAGTAPVKYLLLLIGTPGAPTTERAAAE